MVATPSLAAELEQRGFRRILPWTRGVDTELFRPRPVRKFGAGPVLLYVGRVAVEKNLEAFLALDMSRPQGRRRRRTRIAGAAGSVSGRPCSRASVTGAALADCYSSADVFVFPSRTDTFGMVLLEAMASGLPIAAYPVTGPIDLVRTGQTGVLSDSLGDAARQALRLDRSVVRSAALHYSWETAARMFLGNIETALFASHGRRLPMRQPTATHRPRSA